MPIKPNSNPLNGSTAKNPPNPKTLSKPIEQEGHAEAIRLTRTPDELTLMLTFT